MARVIPTIRDASKNPNTLKSSFVISETERCMTNIYQKLVICAVVIVVGAAVYFTFVPQGV